MKAAVITAHGGPEVIHYLENLPIPEPGHNEVRVKLYAAALNRLDLWVRAGWSGLNLKFPHIIAADGAGTIDAIGIGVTQFQIGDRICIDPLVVDASDPALYTGLENQTHLKILGEHIHGTACEYIVLPTRQLLKLPDHIDFNKAAAAGLVFETAWHSLITRGKLQVGETILIIGASGGVNTASIQIAKLAGATVYVVGSDQNKCQQAQALGADYTINREDEPDWAKAIYHMTKKQGVDVVVDNVGQATLSHSIRATRIGGRILIVGNTSGPHTEIDLRYLFGKQISIIGSSMGPHHDFIKVMNLIFAGKLKPVIGKVLPLHEARQAQEILESGDLFGKVVLRIEG